MTFLVKDDEFEQVRKQVGQQLPEVIRRDRYIDVDESLERYILLKEFPGYFSIANEPAALYYNQYYWAVRVATLHGPDKSLDQWAFKVLEYGEGVEGIDWDIVAEIDQAAKGV